MVVTGYCSRGQLKISRVGTRVKINATYFQEEVMKPIFEEEIPRVYGRDSLKVFIHMDKASSHTAKSSMAYYRRMEAETRIKVIAFSSIPVKSPDAFPMDFCGLVF